MANTEIRVERIPTVFIAGEVFYEPHWLAYLTENGSAVHEWADAYARSYISADDAKQQLLDILDGKRSLQTGR